MVACASPRECEGLQIEAVVLGVGKAAAAASAAVEIARHEPDVVLLFGVAGAYRGAAALAIGDVCMVKSDALVDEGVETPSGFLPMDELGLGEVGPFEMDAPRTARLGDVLGVPGVRAATVSTCSGTDARADQVRARADADVESMEGAAVAVACRAAGVPLIQLRAISNFTGDREHAQWDLDRAVRAVQAAVVRALEVLP